MITQSNNDTAKAVNSTSPILKDRIPITISSAYPSNKSYYHYHCKMIKKEKKLPTISRRRCYNKHITFSNKIGKRERWIPF